MFRTSILAVTAVAVIALSMPTLFTSQAAAQSTAPSSGPSSTPPSSAPPPGDPGDPGDPGGGDPKNGGELPTPPPEEQIAKIEEVCNAALGALVKIPVSMVETFEGGVNVVPVCDNGLGKKANIDASQAMPLQTAIATNPALSGPLAADGLHSDDVVGVVLIDGVATLYVHKGA